jgi:hypothetical protein
MMPTELLGTKVLAGGFGPNYVDYATGTTVGDSGLLVAFSADLQSVIYRITCAPKATGLVYLATGGVIVLRGWRLRSSPFPRPRNRVKYRH